MSEPNVETQLQALSGVPVEKLRDKSAPASGNPFMGLDATLDEPAGVDYDALLKQLTPEEARVISRYQEQHDYSAYFVTGGVLLAFLFIIAVVVRTRLIQRAWRRLGATGHQWLTGWCVWALIVLSYIPLRLDLDDLEEDFWMQVAAWLVLPPLCFAAAWVWNRSYRSNGPGTSS